MAVIYESVHRGYGISTDKGLVQFRHNKVSDLGELNTGDEQLLKAVRLSEKELIALVEDQEDYKNRVPCHVGVWRREERLGAEQKKLEASALKDAIGGLSDASLKALLKEKGVKFNINASHDELVRLVLEAGA